MKQKYLKALFLLAFGTLKLNLTFKKRKTTAEGTAKKNAKV